VILHRLDNAQLSSGRIAEDKARTSVEFRRPTKALEDALAGGGVGLRTLSFGACLAEGGLLVLNDLRPRIADVQSIVSAAIGGDNIAETVEGLQRFPINLRFKSDLNKLGPAPGKPVVVGAGMQGDRASIVFASPKDISETIRHSCP